jgi:hypothetical protein
VARQIALGEIGFEIGLGPVAERVHLEPAVFQFEPRQLRARLRLERLAA